MVKKKDHTLVISNAETSTQHNTGKHHPETANRVNKAYALLKKALISNVDLIKANNTDLENVLLCHSKSYINKLKEACKNVTTSTSSLYDHDSDTVISKQSEEIANIAVGAVIQACDLILTQQYKNAFCLIRPPGHHALYDQAMGFCFYNNVAIGARYLLKKYARTIKKILIVDWDLHHGNGTQSFFQDNPNIYYFSVHLQDSFPNNKKEASIQTKHIRNHPISSAVNGQEEIMSAFKHLSQDMATFRPDLVFISCGFDGHAEEKIIGGGLGLTDEDYITLTKIVKNIASTYCQNRLISVLEGGYNLEALARSIEAHVSTLAKK